jgi:hypothetical protein
VARTGVGITGVTHLRKSGGSTIARHHREHRLPSRFPRCLGIAIDEQNPAQTGPRPRRSLSAMSMPSLSMSRKMSGHTQTDEPPHFSPCS